MKFSSLFIYFFLFIVAASAQTKTLRGFVIDRESKQRLAKVYVYNSHSDVGLYNNNKGEFAIAAKIGDTLFAVLQGYGVDTIIYKGNNADYFQLKPLAIQLREVSIIGSNYSPRQRYESTLKDYKYATDRGSSKDLLNLNSRGAGLGIDAIYNLLSRKGKNARRLQEILERDYKEQVIDYRYNAAFVGKALRISGIELEDYMQQYRPSYDFVLMASDYAFIVYIRNNYASYKRNPKALRLQPLPEIKIDNP